MEQFGDKLAQVTAEAIAVKSYFNDEIAGALVIVAYPQGKATLIQIKRARLDECWIDRLLPRLDCFYIDLAVIPF